MEKIKLMVRKVLIVLLIIWMVAVFCLSHQEGSDSGKLSRAIANFFANGDTVAAEKLEPVVRKVAHMTEYAIGAMLFYGILLTYPKYTTKQRIILAAIFIILYAASDEFHQSFINSRNGSFWDVCIDTIGGAMGIGAIYITSNAITMMDNKVKQDLAEPKLNRK